MLIVMGCCESSSGPAAVDTSFNTRELMDPPKVAPKARPTPRKVAPVRAARPILKQPASASLKAQEGIQAAPKAACNEVANSTNICAGLPLEFVGDEMEGPLSLNSSVSRWDVVSWMNASQRSKSFSGPPPLNFGDTPSKLTVENLALHNRMRNLGSPRRQTIPHATFASTKNDFTRKNPLNLASPKISKGEGAAKAAVPNPFDLACARRVIGPDGDALLHAENSGLPDGGVNDSTRPAEGETSSPQSSPTSSGCRWIDDVRAWSAHSHD